jgi:hypothetical protein
MNDGVSIVLSRMDTHPEEFYANTDKWKFIYSDYYRDSMTETEKGMIFDKLREIRRGELTARVMTVMVEGMKMDKVKDAGGKAFPQPAVLAGGVGGKYTQPTMTDADIKKFADAFKKPV